MAPYRQGDKSYGGTPGLLFRTRLEYALGQRSLSGDRKMLVSMHSQIRSINPQEDSQDPAAEPIGNLLSLNDTDLKTLIIVDKYKDDIPVTDEQRNSATLALETVLYRLDEIIYRAKIIENIRPSEGPSLPL